MKQLFSSSAEILPPEKKAQQLERGGRMLLTDSTVGGVTVLRPVRRQCFWSFNIGCTP
jgi:hypothetical protein